MQKLLRFNKNPQGSETLLEGEEGVAALVGFDSLEFVCPQLKAASNEVRQTTLI